MGLSFRKIPKVITAFSYDMVDWQPHFPQSEGELPTDTEALSSGRVSVTPMKASLAEVDCSLTSVAQRPRGLEHSQGSPWPFIVAAGFGAGSVAIAACE